MAVTIRSAVGDVGVSPATVSLALNNSDMVSANTARRVKKAAERMGYVHNVFARSLANGACRLTLLSAPRAQHAGYALRRLPQRCSPDWMTGSSPALRPCPLPPYPNLPAMAKGATDAVQRAVGGGQLEMNINVERRLVKRRSTG